MLKLELRKIMESPFFNELQDQVSLVTGVSINTVDYKGAPVLERSCCMPFCQLIREHPVLGQRCLKCDALAGLEAVRQNKTFPYLCHCGLVDVAVPILFGDQFLGSVILGQVRLAGSQDEAEIQPLIREVTDLEREYPQRQQELTELYQQIPEMTYGRIMEITELVRMITLYIISQKVDHHNDRLTYEWMLNNGTYPQISRVYPGGEEVSRAGGFPQPPREEALPVPHSSVIYPAVRYIHRHPRERISLNAMADLCHLSPSYFSRTFQREVGENFNEYVNHHKIRQAKEMMKTTNQSIAAIAGVLGFRDTSYFIKVFKKYENMTPQEFKKHS